MVSPFLVRFMRLIRLTLFALAHWGVKGVMGTVPLAHWGVKGVMGTVPLAHWGARDI